MGQTLSSFVVIDDTPFFADFFGVPRHPWRSAILGECSSGGGYGACAADAHEGGFVGGGGTDPALAAARGVEGAVGAELRHLQR